MQCLFPSIVYTVVRFCGQVTVFATHARLMFCFCLIFRSISYGNVHFVYQETAICHVFCSAGMTLEYALYSCMSQSARLFLNIAVAKVYLIRNIAANVGM